MGGGNTLHGRTGEARSIRGDKKTDARDGEAVTTGVLSSRRHEAMDAALVQSESIELRSRVDVAQPVFPTLLPLLQGSLAALATTDILHVLPSMRHRVVNLCVCAREHACKSMHSRGSRASEAGGKTRAAAGKEPDTAGHQASTHQSCNYRHRRCMQVDTARHHVGKELAEIGQAC